MDIRCGSCNKLFRVADDKITGKGIRFKCSRCGEVITVTRDDAASSPPGPAISQDRASAAARIAVPPTAQPSRQPQASAPPPANEFKAQEYQPPVPPAGLDDFDFSESHAAGTAASPQEESPGREGLSFDTTAETGAFESAAGGEISISEEEEKEAETAFRFPDGIVTEPVRKPAFASESASPKEETGPSADLSSEEKQPVPDLTVEESRTPDRAAMKSSSPAVEAKPPSRPPFEPSAEPGEEDEIDLRQATASPKTIEPGTTPSKPIPARVRSMAMPEMQDPSESPDSPPAEHVHPLASGNVTGALAGLGCALPVVLVALFAFSLMAQFVPFFATFPRYHLLVVTGTGLIGLGVLTGIVIALAQAQAGKKLFFLLNVLIGAAFGMVYGTGMNMVTSVASGSGLNLGGIVMGALSGSAIALLLSLLIVIARRVLFFTREESFAAQLSGPQKAGLALSLVIILTSLYAEGTLIGSMEKAAQDIQHQFEAEISPEGIAVINAHGYVDEATGDLVITGAVQNSLEREKEGWYLEVDVFDQHQKILATVKMLNGVQLFDQHDFDILAKRGKNIDELKSGMVLALQGGMIPAKGSVNFEMHLMSPPPGIASFYPTPKKFSFREADGGMPGMQ